MSSDSEDYDTSEDTSEDYDTSEDSDDDEDDDDDDDDVGTSDSDDEDDDDDGGVEFLNLFATGLVGTTAVAEQGDQGDISVVIPAMIGQPLDANSELAKLMAALTTASYDGPVAINIDNDLLQLEESISLPDVQAVVLGVKITGNLQDDLVAHSGESPVEFETRSKITSALVTHPYNLSVKAALIAGKLWCRKALHGAVYSKQIETALADIQSRAAS